jgi:hypothetical protein
VLIHATLQKSLAVLTLWGAWFACSFQPGQSSHKLQREHRPANRLATLIWSGKSGGWQMTWTQSDFVIQKDAKSEALFSPIVKQALAAFSYCDYHRSFAILSVVGNIVSFRDNYYHYPDCNGVHPSGYARFAAIDVDKNGPIQYSGDTDIVLANTENPNKIVKLSDYFSDDEILKGLLDTGSFKSAVDETGKAPASLGELMNLVSQYGLKFDENDNCSYVLPDDVMTRFAFKRLVNSKIAVVLSVDPAVPACGMRDLELLLAIPPKLKESLARAAAQEEGFLMKDEEKIAGKKLTTFSKKTGKAPNKSDDGR